MTLLLALRTRIRFYQACTAGFTASSIVAPLFSFCPPVDHAPMMSSAPGGGQPALCSSAVQVGPLVWDGVTPVIMGILNVTPDSFSDGGACASTELAVAQAEAMAQAGASIIDVGGESTRPGATPISADAELSRVLPVIAALQRRGLPAAISIDTHKAAVAQAALDAGAHIVNDVSALGDPNMGAVVAQADAFVVLMHRQGNPQTMQLNPTYSDVKTNVRQALEMAIDRACLCGISAARIWLDPGLGFGKTFEHNITLLKNLGHLAALGHPIVLGASRKRFLGSITGQSVPHRRDLATAVTCALMTQKAAAQIFRVHNVPATREALAVVGALS